LVHLLCPPLDTLRLADFASASQSLHFLGELLAALRRPVTNLGLYMSFAVGSHESSLPFRQVESVSA
jgi:hypothetical protein